MEIRVCAQCGIALEASETYHCSECLKEAREFEFDADYPHRIQKEGLE